VEWGRCGARARGLWSGRRAQGRGAPAAEEAGRRAAAVGECPPIRMWASKVPFVARCRILQEQSGGGARRRGNGKGAKRAHIGNQIYLLLSLYLSVKRSHHVRREGLEILTSI
jgi:hypothetical protein